MAHESVTEDDPATEDPASGLSEDDPVERETTQRMWLADKVISLENENGELKKAVHKMEAKATLQENTIKELVERYGMMEGAIKEIIEHIQRQNVFNTSAKTTMASLVEEVKTHQGNFQEVAWVLQNHENHITNSETVAQQMTSYINALFNDNENKSLWIGRLMNESQAQADVLQQHRLRQEVLAEVIKRLMVCQQQQPQQTVSGNGPTVTDADDDSQAVQDFRGGPITQARPPGYIPFVLTIEPPQVPGSMEIEEGF